MEVLRFWSILLVVFLLKTLNLVEAEFKEGGNCCPGLWIPNTFSIPEVRSSVRSKLKNSTRIVNNNSKPFQPSLPDKGFVVSKVISDPKTFRPSLPDKGFAVNGGYESNEWLGYSRATPKPRQELYGTHTQFSGGGEGEKNTFITHTHYYSYIFPEGTDLPGGEGESNSNGTSEEKDDEESGRNSTVIIKAVEVGVKNETENEDSPQEEEPKSKEDVGDVEVFEIIKTKGRSGGNMKETKPKNLEDLDVTESGGPIKERGRREGRRKYRKKEMKEVTTTSRSRMSSSSKEVDNIEDIVRATEASFEESSTEASGRTTNINIYSAGGKATVKSYIEAVPAVSAYRPAGVMVSTAPVYGRIVIQSPDGIGRGIPVIARIVVENPDDRDVEPASLLPGGTTTYPGVGRSGGTLGANYNIHVFNQNYAPGGYAVSSGGYRFDTGVPLYPPPPPVSGKTFLKQVWRSWVRRVLLGEGRTP